MKMIFLDYLAIEIYLLFEINIKIPIIIFKKNKEQMLRAR